MKALVLIPTYNERENIEKLVPQVLKQDPCLEILIIDDNSPDGTGGLADLIAASEPRVKVLHRKKKEGLGRAYVAGFHYALDNGYDLILHMDADFSHDPGYLPAILEAAKSNDLVLGSRYTKGGGVENWDRKRLILSRGGNLYAKMILWMPISDATGGFKCFHREVLAAMDLDKVRAGGYSFQIEMTYKAWLKGFRIKEVPIIFKERADGLSKMNSSIIREAVMVVWQLRLSKILGRIK